jgi:hypothetical protein
MNYIALALSVASLAFTLYVYFKGSKRLSEIEAELEELSPFPGDENKAPAAPFLPRVRN